MKSKMSFKEKHLIYYGLRTDIAFRVRILANTIFKKSFKKVFRKQLNPSLSELSSIAEFETIDSNAFLMNMCESVEPSLPNIRAEFDELLLELRNRYREANLVFPKIFAVGNSTSFVIYSLVRLLKPHYIVETGVANGHSTFFILKALKKNQKGTLVSFDVSPKIGALLREGDKERWQLIVLKKNYKKEMESSINNLPWVDLFIHDSDHSFKWQDFEYNLVSSKLNENSVFLSDDIDGSYAFIEYCKKTKSKPQYLVEPAKVFGAIYNKDSIKRILNGVGSQLNLTPEIRLVTQNEIYD